MFQASPAPEPRNCSNAGPKSLVESPCRYSTGNTSLIFLVDVARKRAAELPHASMELISGGRHGLTFDEKGRIAHHVLYFVLTHN